MVRNREAVSSNPCTVARQLAPVALAPSSLSAGYRGSRLRAGSVHPELFEHGFGVDELVDVGVIVAVLVHDLPSVLAT
jgi:hypothetical protein